MCTEDLDLAAFGVRRKGRWRQQGNDEGNKSLSESEMEVGVEVRVNVENEVESVRSV
jgi:hypothetical protein